MLINHSKSKSDFRRLCIQRLKFLSKIAKYKKNKYLGNKLLQLVDSLGAKRILLYIPMESEVDVNRVIQKLRKQRYTQVYVPFMKEDSFVPVLYRLPLKKGKFGIKQPAISYKKVHIDLAIVPIVGVDKDLRRVGFGKGMYDRFFERLEKKPTVVFTQLELCKSQKKLCEIHDIQADYIVTK